MKAGVGTKKHKKETQKIARLKGWSHAKKTLTTDGLMQNGWMNAQMNEWTLLFAKTNIFMALLRMSGRLVQYQLLFNRIQTSIIIADGAFLFVNLPALLCTAAPSTHNKETMKKKTKVICIHASSFYVGGGYDLFCRFLKIRSKSTPYEDIVQRSWTVTWRTGPLPQYGSFISRIFPDHRAILWNFTKLWKLDFPTFFYNILKYFPTMEEVRLFQCERNCMTTKVLTTISKLSNCK